MDIDSLHCRPERPVHYTHRPAKVRFPNESLAEVGIPAEPDECSTLAGILALCAIEMIRAESSPAATRKSA